MNNPRLTGRGCGTKNLGQTYKYIVYTDTFSLIISYPFSFSLFTIIGLVQFIQAIDRFGDHPSAIAIGLLVLLLASTQLLIGGRSLKQRIPNERGIFSKYYFWTKVAYLATFIANNSIVVIHFCKNDPDLEGTSSCRLSPVEIVIIVLWSIIQVYFLQIISLVWKHLRNEDRNPPQPSTEAQNPLQTDVNQIILNIEEVLELIAGIKRYPNPKVVEVKGFPYQPENIFEDVILKDVQTSIPLKKKSITKRKGPAKVEQVNLIQTILNNPE